MKHDQKIQELAADVHDLGALLAALLVCFAAMRRLAKHCQKSRTHSEKTVVLRS